MADFRPIELSRLVKGIYGGLGEELDKEGFTVDLILPEEPVAVNADREEVIQVVLNLISNARKYATPGRGRKPIHPDLSQTLRRRIMTILIAEDEKPIREGLVDLFEAEGYAVLDASDGGGKGPWRQLNRLQWIWHCWTS